LKLFKDFRTLQTLGRVHYATIYTRQHRKKGVDGKSGLGTPRGLIVKNERLHRVSGCFLSCARSLDRPCFMLFENDELH
jgi:hypothetical protein